MATLGKEIQRLRLEAKLTQVDLAEKIGMTQGFVGMIETGKKSIATTNLLFRLCTALGVSSEHFRPYLVAPEVPAIPPPPANKRKK